VNSRVFYYYSFPGTPGYTVQRFSILQGSQAMVDNVDFSSSDTIQNTFLDNYGILYLITTNTTPYYTAKAVDVTGTIYILESAPALLCGSHVDSVSHKFLLCYSTNGVLTMYTGDLIIANAPTTNTLYLSSTTTLSGQHTSGGKIL
jgi:hypothetical protein